MNKILDKATFDIEDFGEEIVLVNFHTGVYFTVKGSGPGILRLFHEAVNVDGFLGGMLNTASPEQIQEVKDFITQLTDDGILTDTDVVAVRTIEVPDLSESPVCEKFEDISDLVKLDPIHDVSDLGWPHKK